MKLLGWIYLALALISATALGLGLLVIDANPFSQLALLIQGVGFAFVSGMILGFWRSRDEQN